MRTSDKTQRRLEGVIDSVAESYGKGRSIDSLESTALPNQRKIVEALVQLEHTIYMGFYSARVLSPINLRQHLGEHLHCAAETLIEQSARAVAYQRHGGGSPDADDVACSEDAVLGALEQIPSLREQLSLDVTAAFEGDPAASSIEEVIFCYPVVQAITVYRIARELHLRKVPMVPRIMTEYAHSKTGIEIHPGARIGKGFFIDHGTGVVIGETSVIGDNVKIYQGVTLGALSVPRCRENPAVRAEKRHPTIENEVTIYAGATILGGDTVIGRGSVIGSNCWVTRSVPPNTRVSFSGTDADGLPRQVYDVQPPPKPCDETK